jgi:hypothetical protein
MFRNGGLGVLFLNHAWVQRSGTTAERSLALAGCNINDRARITSTDGGDDETRRRLPISKVQERPSSHIREIVAFTTSWATVGVLSKPLPFSLFQATSTSLGPPGRIRAQLQLLIFPFICSRGNAHQQSSVFHFDNPGFLSVSQPPPIFPRLNYSALVIR